MNSVWGESDKCPTVASPDGPASALLALASGASPVQGPLSEEPPTDPQPDAPPKLRGAFWLLVVSLNLSIGALAVGLMLVGFRSQSVIGGALVLVGAGGLALAYVRYRTVRRKLDRGELTDDDANSDGAGDGLENSG
jgi:hypothetical protein